MVTEVIGDVFKAQEDVLIHGCNCFHTWGAGVAKKMRQLYPKAYEQDLKTVKGDKDKLGSITHTRVPHYFYPERRLYVVNLYSQYNYGNVMWGDPRQSYHQADYDAIKSGMEMVRYVFGGHNIAMPRIGAGLAGGDWNVIRKIIQNVFKSTAMKIVIYRLEE